MAKSLTNSWTYIGIIFIFAMIFLLVLNFADFLQKQDNKEIIDLGTDQKQYILELKNIDYDNITPIKTDLEDPISYEYNSSTGNPKDYAIEFLFTQEKSTTIVDKIKYVYKIPNIVVTLLGLPDVFMINVLVGGIFFLLVTGIFFAIIYFIRGLLS